MEFTELNPIDERLAHEENLDAMAADNLAKGDADGFNLRVNAEEVCFPKHVDALKEYEEASSAKDNVRLMELLEVLLEAYKYAEQFYTRSNKYIDRVNEQKYRVLEDMQRQNDKIQRTVNTLVTMVDVSAMAQSGLNVEDMRAEFERLCSMFDDSQKLGIDAPITPEGLVNIGTSLNRLRGLPDDTPLINDARVCASADAGNTAQERTVATTTQEPSTGETV